MKKEKILKNAIEALTNYTLTNNINVNDILVNINLNCNSKDLVISNLCNIIYEINQDFEIEAARKAAPFKITKSMQNTAFNRILKRSLKTEKELLRGYHVSKCKEFDFCLTDGFSILWKKGNPSDGGAVESSAIEDNKIYKSAEVCTSKIILPDYEKIKVFIKNNDKKAPFEFTTGHFCNPSWLLDFIIIFNTNEAYIDISNKYTPIVFKNNYQVALLLPVRNTKTDNKAA